jgi:DNA-binding IclR family transcriptional regulator
MGCVNPDGTLSSQAQSILDVLDTATDLGEVAQKTGLPLYRVRAAVRELSEAKLVQEIEGRYCVADADARS